MQNGNYKKLLEKRRKEYKNYFPIICPCIKELINFNSEGFNHLQFHINGMPRKQPERIYKLNLLPLAIPTIKLANRLEKYDCRKGFIGKKDKNRGKIKKEIEYWAIMASVGKNKIRVRVILRKIGNGKIHFWSIMKLRN